MAAVAEAAQNRQQQGRPVGPAPPGRGPAPPPPGRPRFQPVDREKTCPLLLRVFTKVGGHHAKEEFAIRGKEPKEEVQIYTWKDASLRELTDLVKEVASAARRRDAKLSFAFVYPDKQGRFVVRPVGMTYSYPGNGRRQDDMKTLAELGFQVGMTYSYPGNGRRQDDMKTLAELGFQIGDYLDVAIS